MSYADHDHRGDYADQRHDHDGDYAERYHRHYDDESTVRGLREDLSRAEERIREMENNLRDAFERIRVLEGQTPQARQLQLEADQAAADLAESGYDREYDLGPEADDPDEPSNRELEPEPPGWYDVPDLDEAR